MDTVNANMDNINLDPQANNGKIGRNELIEMIAEKTGFPRSHVAKMMKTMLETLTENMAAGKNITLTGFGTFEIRERQARTGVVPGTDKRIEIPARTYPAFKPGKGLKDHFLNH